MYSGPDSGGGGGGGEKGDGTGGKASVYFFTILYVLLCMCMARMTEAVFRMPACSISFFLIFQ